MGELLADPGSRKGNKELYGSQTEDESPDMSPPGDPARLSMAHRCVKELNENPVTEEKDGRQFKEKGEEEYGDHCENFRTGKEEKIGPHYAGNGTAGPYGWETGMPVGHEMDQNGGNTAQDIEGEKTGWSQPVFHVVPKDIEKPHVPQQVEKSAMEEHIAEEWNHLCQDGEVTRDSWV